MVQHIQKPVWAEGVFLTQQHFQQWDQYVTQQSWLRMRFAHPWFWGIVEMEIDEASLLAGRFRLLQCQALFQNGQMVVFSGDSSCNLSCNIEDKHVPQLSVYLCVPLSMYVNGIPGYEERQDPCGFTARFDMVPDMYDMAREREIMCAEPQWRLLCDDEDRAQYVSLKIAELRKNAEGQYVLDRHFIPTVLHISASQRLNVLLQGLLDRLTAKRKLLEMRKRNYDGDFVQFGNMELANFLLLQVLANGMPTLRHIATHQQLHPVLLYLELIKLLSILESFSNVESHEAMPDYQHQSLSSTFATLILRIEHALDNTFPAHMIKLPLQKKDKLTYIAEHIDAHLLFQHSFYLAIQYVGSDRAWIKRFLDQTKIACISDIEKVIHSALPSLPIRHIATPPHQLPLRNGYEYFLLEQQGEYWDHVQAEENMVIFLPQVFTDSVCELLVVRDA